MATRNVVLTEAQEALIERLVAAGRYQNASEVLRSGLRLLEEQEAEEVRRILLALTDAFRVRASDLHRTIEAATELDVRQARARYAQSIDASEPKLSTDGAFERSRSSSLNLMMSK